MQHYASNKAVGVNNLRFLFEGRRLQPTDTPSDLGLEARRSALQAPGARRQGRTGRHWVRCRQTM